MVIVSELLYFWPAQPIEMEVNLLALLILTWCGKKIKLVNILVLKFQLMAVRRETLKFTFDYCF